MPVSMLWVHTRGRIEKGSGDHGTDLVMMKHGGFPQVLLSGEKGVAGAIFSPLGEHFVVQTVNTLLYGTTADNHDD